MWDRFFRQWANIGITRSCMRWYRRNVVCGLSCISNRLCVAYLVLVMLILHGKRCGTDFFRQWANIGITRFYMRWYRRKIESIIGVQWGQKNPNLMAHCSSEKQGLPSFPLNGGPKGLDFSGTTEHQWSILFSYTNSRLATVSYGTVQYNICWWRHCIQSLIVQHDKYVSRNALSMFKA